MTLIFELHSLYCIVSKELTSFEIPPTKILLGMRVPSFWIWEGWLPGVGVKHKELSLEEVCGGWVKCNFFKFHF